MHLFKYLLSYSGQVRIVIALLACKTLVALSVSVILEAFSSIVASKLRATPAQVVLSNLLKRALFLLRHQQRGKRVDKKNAFVEAEKTEK